MELRHLRYFVGVAEAENVSRAAFKLHISQPAVSRQIRDLEDEIGLPLLKRVGKSVRLTEAGRLFLNEARAILARTDEALRNVRALDEHQRIELHVGYCSYAIDPLFHRILRTYQGAMPNVRVKLHDRKVEENVDALLEGRLHLAFIFHRAEARRASRSAFSPIEPRAPSPRRFAQAPTRPAARCLTRGGGVRTVRRPRPGRVPRLPLLH